MSDDLDERILKERVEPAPATLREITRVAEQAVDLEQTIKELEQQLDVLRVDLNALRFDRLPGLMIEAGLTAFQLADGSKVAVEDYIQGSLPKDPVNRASAIGVLEAAGGEALIRNQVICNFEKKQHNRAIEVARELQDRGLDVRIQQDVHHSTLQAFVREKLRHGEELPYEKLGIFVGRRAVIKPADNEARDTND